jgi:hypothetical protein
MIDEKIFAELQNRGIITNVGLKAEDYKNIDELKNHGLATSIATEEVYADIVNDINYLETFLAEVKAGGLVTLDGDIILNDYIEIRNEVTIDLNGYNILHPMTSPSKYPDVFEVMTGGKLTLIGEGIVIAENGYSVYAAGDSVVTINGGTYISPVSAVDARKNASVTINGGTFKVDGSNNPDGDFGQKYTLNLRDKVGNYVGDTSEIVVKGGKFYKYNPAASESEPQVTNFVAAGYESVLEGDYYIVKEVKDIVVDDNK